MRKIEELKPISLDQMVNMGLYQYMLRSTNIEHDIKVTRRYMRKGKELTQEFWVERLSSESGKQYLVMPSSIVLRRGNKEQLQIGKYFIEDKEVTLKNPAFSMQDYSISIFEAIY